MASNDVTIRVGTQAAASEATLEDLKKRLNDLGRMRETVNVAISDKASIQAKEIGLKLDQLGRKVTSPKISLDGIARADLEIDKLKLKLDTLNKSSASPGVLGRIGNLVPGLAGTSGGASGAGALAPAAGSGLMNPYVLGGAAAAAAATAPFVAQLAGGGIVTLFGAALAGLAIKGASSAKSVQKSFADLQKNASADLVKIGASFVPVMNSIYHTASSVLGQLTPVFANAAKIISGPFKTLADTLVKAFGQPAVKQSITDVANAFGMILKAVTPALTAGIGKVATGISEIAVNISKMNPAIITHFTNALFDVVAALLDTIAWLIKVGTYVEDHFGPAMHRVAVIFDGVRHDTSHIWDMLFQDLVGSQIRFVHNVETQFNSVRHETAVIFDGIRHDVAHIWDLIFSNSIGSAIRIGHNVETEWNSFRHATANIYDGVRHDIASIWDSIWNNTVGRVQRGVHDVENWFNNLRHNISTWFSGFRHDVSTGWDALWSNTIGQVQRGIGSVVNWFRGLPAKIRAAIGNAGKILLQAGKDVIQGFWNGLTSIWSKVTGWISGIAGWIKAHKGPLSLDQSLLHPAGAAMMNGFLGGLKSGFGPVGSFVGGIAGWVLGKIKGAGGKLLGGKVVADTSQFSSQALAGSVGGGVARWKGVVDQALRMEGLSTAFDSRVLYQMQTESGGNPNAINLTDINAQRGDPSRGLMQVIMSTFRAYHWPGTSGNIYNPLANIAAAINYAKHTYGPQLGNQYGGIGSGHGYAAGGAASGWAMVGERGAELVRLPVGSTVYPHGASMAMAGGGGQVIQLQISGGQSDFDQFLLQWLKKNVRVLGGGNVQTAFGRK